MARRAYYNQAPWKRIVVILAGPGVNLLIAFGLFWAILASGSLSGAITLENLNRSIQTVGPSVAGVEKGSPAEGILQPGDQIIAVDGHSASFASTVGTVSSHRCAGALVNGCLAPRRCAWRFAAPAMIRRCRYGPATAPRNGAC